MRSRWLDAGRRSTAAAAAFTLVAATALVTAVTIPTATPAAAAPGNPGVPGDPTVLFAEDFETGVGSEPVLLTDYVGAAPDNATYTADTVWLESCNGAILQFDAPDSALDGPVINNCQPTERPEEAGTFYGKLRQLAWALGAFTGADPAANHAVSAYTSAEPGPDQVEFATVDPISLPSANGRYVTFSVDAAAVNCTASAPAYNFSLVSEASTIPVGGVIDVCTGGETVSVPGVGEAHPVDAHVGRYTTDGSVLVTGSTLGVQMTNSNGSGTGNDAAFDNIQILDVTPQLDKGFAPGTVDVGAVSTLTLTVTNTGELAAKDGWGFTDTLADGLVIAPTPNVGGSCAADVTAAAGSSVIAVSGGTLPAGTEACTITVDVTSSEAGTYTNGPDNITDAVGIDAPGDSEITFVPQDFGDAPNDYGTTSDAGGAHHSIPGYDADGSMAPVMLGASIDAENDGQPGPAADRDDTTGAADEDGVVFNPALGYGVPTLRSGLDTNTRQPVENTLQVTASADGFVSVWVDWNVDGDFDDAGEQVAAGQPVAAGTNQVRFTQGDNPPQIHTYVRVRYSTDADAVASATGPAPDGEVEDYRVQVERLVAPAACTTNGIDYYAFTYTSVTGGSGAGGPGTSVRFTDVSVVAGQAVDMVVEVLDGTTNSIRVGTGGIFETDDANWQINRNVTLRYTFVAAGTNTPVAVNGAFTANDMDGPPSTLEEIATFSAADLADFAVTQGSAVTVTEQDGNVSFAGNGDHNGDPGSRFQVVLEGIDTFQVDWQGGPNSGFGFDGDGDLSIDPACSDFGDAPDSYGTTVDADGARTTIARGLTLGTLIDLDPDGQPNDTASGDDTDRVADEDGVAAPILARAGQPTSVPVTVTNDTGEPATLAGWIDLNGNGMFDADERQLLTVPSGTAAAEYTLTWPGRSVPSDPTFARFRLYAGEIADPSPIGEANGGEVEDYPVQTRALAISKTADAPDNPRLGDTVTYTVTATNVGSTDYTADDPAQVIDDLTDVLDDATFDGTVAVDGTDIAASYTAPRITWTGPLAADESISLTYTVTLNRAGDQNVQNVAFQPPACDADDCSTPPTPDPLVCMDTGVDPETGLPCDGTNLLLPRLTVDKTSPDLGTAQIGDTVHYTITATNTGRADYSADAPATMVDDLSGVLDDGSYSDDAQIIDDGPGAVSYTEPQITWTGALAVDESVSVTYSVVLGGDGDQQVDNVVFETPTCTAGDCPPPVPPIGDNCAANDGVDPATGLSCRPVVGGLPKLELTKSAPDLAQGRIGDTITWTVTATNVGGRAFTDQAPATIVDDLTGVLDDASFDGTVTVDGSDVAADYTAPQISWSGRLGVGRSVTLTYSAVLTGAGDGQVDNVTWQLPTDDPGCEFGSCRPPDPATCAETGVDPETGLPCDTVRQPLPRPELDKTSPDAATARVGDTVTYRVTFTNVGPGDYTQRRPAQIADDLSGLLDDATFDGTVEVAGSDIAATVVGSQILWTGPVAAGEQITLTYRVTVTGAGDQRLENLGYVPPSPPLCTTDECPPPDVPTPPSVDGCAETGVDPDTGLPCIFVQEPLPVLELTKSSPELASAAIGDTVSYTVTATNIGERDYTADAPAEVIDDLTGVLDDATFGGTVAVDGSDIAASYTEPRITWSGPLAVGDTVTLTYRVTLTGAGDMSVVNVAFAPPACDIDECPEPPTPPATDCLANGGIDPATGLPCVPVTGNLRQLAIDKSSDATPVVRNGDVVTYTVTATNTGQADYTADDPAVLVDDLAGVLDDAVYNADAAADRDGAVGVAGTQLSWIGALPAGASVTLRYSVTVTGAGDLDLRNVAFTPPPGENDCAADGACTPPPECIDGADPETGLPCVVHRDPLPGLYVTKTVDSSTVDAGEVLGYTVTLTNTGRVDFTDADPAALTDDLADVLDDATYNGDVAANAGDVAVDGSTLTWRGPLAIGESVTITYSVTATDSGDGRVLNVVAFDDGFTPRYPDGGCPDGAEQCDPPSRQATALSGVGAEPVDPPAQDPQPEEPPLATTGFDVRWPAGIGLLVLLAGAALLVIDRRRNAGDMS